MSVHYLETANVAHVMVWRGTATWGSKCRTVDDMNCGDYPYVDGIGWTWPVKYVGGMSGPPPTKPWCRRCVHWLIQETAEILVEVLEPAARQRRARA